MTQDLTPQAIMREILQQVESGELTLPTLPSMAQKILKASQDDSLTTESLTNLIEQDPAIAAHLVRIANSPLVGSKVDITDLKTAIGLFGVSYCSQLAISLALKQLFRARHKNISGLIEKTWEQSSRLASLCMVMAKDYNINPGSAYLAGLLHKIGALPILRWLDNQDSIPLTSEQIQQLLDEHQAQLAEQLLDDWQFPPSLCSVPHNYLNMDHNGKDSADLTDLVASAYFFLSEQKKDWQDCKVLERMGVTTEEIQKRMMAWQTKAASA